MHTHTYTHADPGVATQGPSASCPRMSSGRGASAPCATYGVPYLLKPVDPPVNDGARSLAIIHVAIVQGSTGEPWRGPDGCVIHVGDGNTAPDPVSKSEKARL